uniref:Glucose-6-phosphate isomerase n=1 Tax=Lygus hesperus TaxID=30085 RepID=A0A0A9XP37_LYGHE
MVSVMQNHYFTPYPSVNQYSCYNGALTGMFPKGQTTEKALNVGPYQYYYGNWPWGLNSSNMMSTNAIVGNGLNFGNPHYFNPFYAQWASYPYSSWFNGGHSPYPQATTWQPYYPFWTNPWNPATANNGTYYAWPTINYNFRNPIQYPSYTYPSPAYWGPQQIYSYKPEVQQGGVQDRNTQPGGKGTPVLQNTSSDVIRAFHVPSIVARKTVSDIPRSKDCSISKKKSETSTVKVESEDGFSFLVKISDSSIRQIAPSRSFGPSMVHNTESDPNDRPPSSLW